VLAIASASSAEDFEIAARFCRAFGAWDATQAPAHGVSGEEVVALFHTETSNSLATKYNSRDAKVLIARWESSPAGCVAFNPFDDEAMELHKFYVDLQYRGRGIGRELLRTALATVAKGPRRKALLHTAFYMTDAISMYESFGFQACARFRPTPDSVSHTDVFMSRTI
jgi:GNAT superfamily N-acetyltransferase